MPNQKLQLSARAFSYTATSCLQLSDLIDGTTTCGTISWTGFWFCRGQSMNRADLHRPMCLLYIGTTAGHFICWYILCLAFHLLTSPAGWEPTSAERKVTGLLSSQRTNDSLLPSTCATFSWNAPQPSFFNAGSDSILDCGILLIRTVPKLGIPFFAR